MTIRGTAVVTVIVLVLAGCASSSGRHERVTNYPRPAGAGPAPSPAQPMPPASGPSPVPAQPVPISPDQQVPAVGYPKTAEEVSGQAVVSLMKEARDDRAQNQPDRAAETLERAMRIEPRNYFVWSMLAQVYLEQENYDQAISVAGKSNSLARGNVYVEIDNWKTIGAARAAQGDSIGALQAQSKVDELQRQIGG